MDARAQIAAAGSDLERAFDGQYVRLGEDLPEAVAHFPFDPSRKWEFDRAWPPYLVAVEIEGGEYGPSVVCQNCGSQVRSVKQDGTPGGVIMVGGYHTRFARFRTDCEKYNRAAELGWAVLRFLNEDIYGDPFAMVSQIRHALSERRYRVPIVDRLPPDQATVLTLVAAGFNSEEIARRIDRSDHTVKRMMENVFVALGVTNRPAAVARAIAWGVLDVAQIPFAIEQPVDLGAIRRKDEG